MKRHYIKHHHKVTKVLKQFWRKVLILILPIVFSHLFVNWKRTPLHRSCEEGKLKIVKLLLEKGADFDRLDNDNESPLFVACGKNLSIVKLLIEKGAKTNTRDKYNMTPLYKAAENGRIKIVKYLVSLGVDLNDSYDDIYFFYFLQDSSFYCL